MVEMKDDPSHARDQYNTTPLYAAVFRLRGKEVSSGWREDQPDTIALAIRHNGYVLRGWFAEAMKIRRIIKMK